MLVFSKASGRLYGFDQFGASAFSFLEQRIGSKEELLQAVGDNKVAHSVIYTISDLLNGQERLETQSSDGMILDYPPTLSRILHNNPFYYQLDDFTFLIDTNNALILEKILPALSHIECKQTLPEKASVNIGFVAKGERWSICFNGEAVFEGLTLDEILPRVLDYIRIAYYRSFDYLISLHAGALYFNKTPLIMPAISGSGKSTLSAYLMYQENFEFLTDEVAIIDRDSCICPIPFSITLKEGSWKVLESYDIPLDNLPMHRRFDGQRLRFLPPQQIATENLKLDGAYLVFPRYVAGASTKVMPITTLETLSIITTSGYEVFDSYDETTIEQWVDIVEKFKKYTLTYSNLEDARQHIERLMSP